MAVHMCQCMVAGSSRALSAAPGPLSRSRQARDDAGDGLRLRQERVVARLHLDDLVRAAGEFALRRRRGAPVLGAHHVRRGQVVPRRRPYGLLGHGQRLPDQKGRCVAVYEEAPWEDAGVC